MNVARVGGGGGKRKAEFLWKKLRKRGHFEDLGVRIMYNVEEY